MIKRLFMTCTVVLFLCGPFVIPSFSCAESISDNTKQTDLYTSYVSKMKSNGLSVQEQQAFATILEQRSDRTKLVQDILSNKQNGGEQVSISRTELLILTFILVFSLLLVWGVLVMFLYYMWQAVHIRAIRAKKIGLDVSP